MKKNELVFIGCESKFKDAKTVMFGAPFDGTTTFRPGTRFAPNVIRNESYGLETYSPNLDKSLEELKIADVGDIELVFGNPVKITNQIKKMTQKILKKDKIPFMIGGEHLVTYGAFQAIHEKYPDVNIIHIDAHTDLREQYLGQEYTHSGVIRKCYDLTKENKIFQFGIRSGLKEEFDFVKNKIYMEKYTVETIGKIVEKLQNKPVYITIDLDVLDPAYFPGTGTPEPNGITSRELFKAIYELKQLNNIVGADVVELAPNYDQTGASTAVAAKVIREMLLIITK